MDASFTDGNIPFYEIDRGPFQRLADFERTIIQAQRLELGDPAILLLKSELDLLPEEKRVRDRLESDHEEHVARLLHPYDREQILKYGMWRYGSSDATESMAILEAHLSRLAAMDENEFEGRNYLIHDDLSSRKIMVDDDGNITAILDWELNGFGPLVTKRNEYHELLQAKKSLEDCEDQTDEHLLETVLERRACRAEAGDDRWYEGFLALRLRQLWRREVEEVDFPLQWLYWDGTLDREPLEHVMHARGGARVIMWVDRKVKEFDAKHDDEDEDGSGPEQGIEAIAQ